MAISLVIDWQDGRQEEVPIGSYRNVLHTWSEVGAHLGLRWVPLFKSLCPVMKENLAELIDEVLRLRAEYAGEPERNDETLSAIDAVLDAFERLRQADGWDASIG